MTPDHSSPTGDRINPRIEAEYREIMRRGHPLRMILADKSGAVFFGGGGAACAWMAFRLSPHRDGVLFAVAAGTLFALWMFSAGLSGRIGEVAGRWFLRGR
jgi:hypothetical protein